jgi:hypothetical protein
MKAILALEDAVEGGEEQEHDTKHQGCVQGEREDHGRANQKHARTHQRLDKRLARRQLVGQFRPQLWVPRRNTKAGGLLLEDDAGRRLTHDTDSAKLGGSSKDGQQPKRPAPAVACRQEPADNGAEHLHMMSSIPFTGNW